MKNRTFYLLLFFLFTMIIHFPGYAQKIHWTRKADLPTGRWLGDAVVCNDKIYVIGGRGPEFRAIYEYNPGIDKWSTKSFLPEYYEDGTIAHLAIGTINNKIYIVGGSAECKTECYDPVSGQWNTMAPIPTPRYHTTYCVLNNRMHVIGGSFGRNQPATEHEIFDPLSDAWQEKTSIPHDGSVIAVNSQLYLIGGMDLDISNLSEVYLYNPDKDIWINKCNAPIPPLGFGIVTVDDKIYTIGGQTNTTDGDEEITANIFMYNPLENSWIQIEDFPMKIQFAQAAIVGDKFFVIGGCDEEYHIFNSLWCGQLYVNSDTTRVQ